MALIEFKNLPDRSTPLTAGNLNFNFKEILNLIYPIGISIMFDDNEDHSDFLGFTWERNLVNLTPIGCDEEGSNIGETKGSENHKHTLVSGYADAIATNGVFYENYIALPPRPMALKFNTGPQETFGQNITYAIKLGGTTDEESSYQPSKVVAYWKRVA